MASIDINEQLERANTGLEEVKNELKEFEQAGTLKRLDDLRRRKVKEDWTGRVLHYQFTTSVVKFIIHESFIIVAEVLQLNQLPYRYVYYH